MNKTSRALSMLGVALLVAALATGCEDSGLTAPTDGAIVLRVNPSTLVIDPNTQQPDPVTLRYTVQASVEALLVDGTGLPQQGVAIFFSTSAGKLASADPTTGSKPVLTDASGIARDVLTLTDADPDTIAVTAQSGSLIETTNVTKIVVGANELPRAVVNITPRLPDSNNNLVDEAPVGTLVTFDGSSSIDPDSRITCYQWTVRSDNPDANKPNPIFIQGTGASGFQQEFDNEQMLGVTLLVSDDPDATPGCDTSTPVAGNLFSPFAFFGNHEIVCANNPPTAIINGPPSINATPGLGGTADVVFDGRPSFDGETALDQYLWNCGNGIPPQPVDPAGAQVLCRYTLGTYTASLTVTDRGTNQIDPATGTWQCQRSSPPASVQVTVRPPGS